MTDEKGATIGEEQRHQRGNDAVGERSTMTAMWRVTPNECGGSPVTPMSRDADGCRRHNDADKDGATLILRSDGDYTWIDIHVA